MKQLFLGLWAWIVISFISFFFLWNVFFEWWESDNNPGWQTNHSTEEDIEEGIELDVDIVWEEKEIVTEQKVAIKYIESKQDTLIDTKEMNDFMENSPYGFAITLFAVKHKNIDLWNSYWNSLYDSMEEKPFEKDLYNQKITESFEQISKDTLTMEEYIPYLLDGAIYFSKESLENKKNVCKESFTQLEGESAPSDGVEYCISLSYVFEAIRKDDVSFCSQISYIPEDTALVENCELLFDKN